MSSSLSRINNRGRRGGHRRRGGFAGGRAPFLPPPPPPPFFAQPYFMQPPPLYYGPMPVAPGWSAFPPPRPDSELPSKIMKQIDYYFSKDNLVKDTYLRQHMDGEGWVCVNLIAGFKKITQLTNNTKLILDSLQASNVVEVQGDKVRCKTDWIKWILPPPSNTQNEMEKN